MAEMISIPSSTSIARYGYLPEKEILLVDYHKTGMYEFYNVSDKEYNMIVNSEEPSKVINKMNKTKRFKRWNGTL